MGATTLSGTSTR